MTCSGQNWINWGLGPKLKWNHLPVNQAGGPLQRTVCGADVEGKWHERAFEQRVQERCLVWREPGPNLYQNKTDPDPDPAPDVSFMV